MRACNAAVVALMHGEVFFAKSADSVEKVHSIIFDDVCRVMEEYNCTVKLESMTDSFGEFILVCTALPEDTGINVVYKACFNDREEEPAVKESK